MDNIKLINNSCENNLYNELIKSLNECKAFYFNIAFISYSGLQLIIKSLNDNNIKGKIITSTYLNFSEVKALEKIKSLANIEGRVYLADDRGYHAKAYLFEYDDYYKVIIGSANLTASALKSNIEWNVSIVLKQDDDLVKELLDEYNKVWDECVEISDEFLCKYQEFKSYHHQSYFKYQEKIKPNKMQIEAIKNLEKLRLRNEKKALVIAATGSGKTYMSAFDVRNFNPKRCLFIAHRNEILEKSIETYQKVLGSIKVGLYNGNKKESDATYLFASINTLVNNYKQFNQDSFDYIVVDEAHHIGASSYQKVLAYFKPAFLLGMSATPERCDGFDLINYFDYNIALELRLNDALKQNLVVPFHYFGIDDQQVDLSEVDLNKPQLLTSYLNISERVDYIINQIDLIGYDGDYLQALGFCVSKEHAKFMSDKFNEKGIKSVYLSGDNSNKERELYIKKLENHEISVIFSVDIFNEGVDIPSINMVLMLRPTNSAIVFLQQLGRGLRKCANKQFLTVLDFIGNHQKAFLSTIAFNKYSYYDKNRLMTSVKHNFSEIEGDTFIQLDEICKERILKQIHNENFMQLAYLKDNYFQFKKYLNKIPAMCDYLNYDCSFDPIRFIKYSKNSYLDFIIKVDNEINTNILDDEVFKVVIKYLSTMLPIKRAHEFVLLLMIIKYEYVSFDDYQSYLKTYTKHLKMETIKHAINQCTIKYQDTREVIPNIALIDFDGDVFRSSELFKKLLHDPIKKQVLLDVLEFGLLKYQYDFDDYDYGYPFLKLYEMYNVKDIPIICNYDKNPRYFFGGGIKKYLNNYFLFITLYEEGSDIYSNNFIDNRTFYWQTRSMTTQTSKEGMDLIYNQKRNINLHIFMRKYTKEDNITQPFMYLGLANTIAFESNKPINLKLELVNKIPVDIFNLLNSKENN